MKLLILCLLFTSCAVLQKPPVVKPISQRSYIEKQEDKTYTCLKELMDKTAMNGLRVNLENISGACMKIFMNEGCK